VLADAGSTPAASTIKQKRSPSGGLFCLADEQARIACNAGIATAI